jgi:hypothetical protein
LPKRNRCGTRKKEKCENNEIYFRKSVDKILLLQKTPRPNSGRM